MTMLFNINILLSLSVLYLGMTTTKSARLPPCEVAPMNAAFHGEKACDVPDGNRDEIERGITYDFLKDTGTSRIVPTRRTVVCPERQDYFMQVNPQHVTGFDTTWIMENRASVPVAISYVKPNVKLLPNGRFPKLYRQMDGPAVPTIEVSAMNHNMSVAEDPTAIVPPGGYKIVKTYEGHLYHVREWLGGMTGSEILLQFRQGLVPIWNRNTDIPCTRNITRTTRKRDGSVVQEVIKEVGKIDVEPVNPVTAQTKENFQRTQAPPVRRCNVIDVGFRNLFHCPVHVYWAGTMENIPKSGKTCKEKFSFHLGTNPIPQDFMHDWVSATKFEGSFVGHTFVARLATNPKIVIDSYTLETTKVMDCSPSKKLPIFTGNSPSSVSLTIEGTISSNTTDNLLGYAMNGGALPAAAATTTAAGGGGVNATIVYHTQHIK